MESSGPSATASRPAELTLRSSPSQSALVLRLRNSSPPKTKRRHQKSPSSHMTKTQPTKSVGSATSTPPRAFLRVRLLSSRSSRNHSVFVKASVPSSSCSASHSTHSSSSCTAIRGPYPSRATDSQNLQHGRSPYLEVPSSDKMVRLTTKS